MTTTITITGGTDFLSAGQTVSVDPSDSGSINCAEIGIIDDVIFEGDEQFLVRFGSISNAQVTVGEIPVACVTIEDDEGQFNITELRVLRVCTCACFCQVSKILSFTQLQV